MSRSAILKDFCWFPFMGGIGLYPYRVIFGLSISYWRGSFTPIVRVSIGNFEAWLALSFKKIRETGGLSNPPVTSTVEFRRID